MLTTAVCFGLGVATALVCLALGHGMETGQEPRQVLKAWLGRKPRPIVLDRVPSTLSVGGERFPVTVVITLELPNGVPAARLLETRSWKYMDVREEVAS